tara:strand:+ start:424 stop:1251 length:828 start_codon:yes stop_codon:yes gene_type:complete
MIQEQTHKKLKLAYIAGFIDGDGCIHTSLIRRNDSGISVGITDFEPVQFIAKYFNKNVTKRLENSPFKVKPRYFTSCKGITIIPHLKSLLPFLMEKRNNAFKILKQYNAYENFPYLQHSREEFFAWLAGFSEAEGHFGTRKRKTSLNHKRKIGIPSSKKIYNYIEVLYQLVNTNESLMNYILSKLRDYGITQKMKLTVIKGHTRTCPVTKKMITRKPLHRLFLGGGDLLLLYREIYPFMKIERKKDQIIKSIKLMKEKRYKRKRLKEALKIFEKE